MMTDETANRRLEPFLLCNGLIVVLEIWRDFPKDQIKKIFGIIHPDSTTCVLLSQSVK